MFVTPTTPTPPTSQRNAYLNVPYLERCADGDKDAPDYADMKII